MIYITTLHSSSYVILCYYSTLLSNPPKICAEMRIDQETGQNAGSCTATAAAWETPKTQGHKGG